MYPDTGLTEARAQWEKLKALRDSGRDVEAALAEEGKAGLLLEELCPKPILVAVDIAKHRHDLLVQWPSAKKKR